ncbi:hypothetical protein MMC18_001940 [Xylographa bjoerkii]|nr:hypothetical protein [Xylographa bjoerkii]
MAMRDECTVFETLDRLLEYLYTGDYDDGNSIPYAYTRPPHGYQMSHSRPLSFFKKGHDKSLKVDTLGQPTNAVMYAIGERYDIAPLKDLATSKFSQYASYIVWTDQLPEVLELVYTLTPDSDRGLRDLTKKWCGENSEIILLRQDVTDVMFKVHAIGLDLWKGLLEHSESQRTVDLARIRLEKHERLKMTTTIDEFRQDATEAHARTHIIQNKLEQSEAFIECLRNCKACRRAFATKVSTACMDPLTYKGCVKCQDAKRICRFFWTFVFTS